MHQILIFHTLVGIILEIRKVPLKVHSLKETKFPFYECIQNQFRQVWPLLLSYRICLRWVCRKTALFGEWSTCNVTHVGDPRLLNALLGKGYLYFSGHVGFCSIEVSLD